LALKDNYKDMGGTFYFRSDIGENLQVLSGKYLDSINIAYKQI